MSVRDTGSEEREPLEPDYDSAAQAAMVLAAASLGIKFAHEAQRLAEKYYRDKTEELSREVTS